MDIQQILEGIPGFNGARVVQQLSDGPTNTSLLLELSGERFVLRLDKPAARELGLNRENEQQVLTALATAGLAPQALYSNVSEGVLLRPYLPGKTWTEKDLKGKTSLRRLARLLSCLHSLAPTGMVFNPLGAARRYARQSATTASARVLEQAEQLAEEIAGWPQPTVLCHNDPVCHNILQGESLALIDWEYAAVGDRYFDLAVVLQHHGVNDALSRYFLDSYLERSARADERRHLDQQRRFYQCLLQLWNVRILC